jgi:serine/threonine-protein kinase
MLFQMLAGVLPFRGDSMAELMYKIANEPAPDIRIIRKELSDKLADIVALSLTKRSEMRYQDGDQFAADLRAVMADLAGDAVATVATVTNTAVGASAALTGNHQAAEKTVAFTPAPPGAKLASEVVATQFSEAAPNGPAANYDVTQAMNVDQLPAFETTMVTRPDVAGLPPGDADTDIKL